MIRKLRSSMADETLRSRRGFAERLEVAQVTLRGWENGAYRPRTEQLAAIGNLAAEANDADLAVLFWGWAGVRIEALAAWANRSPLAVPLREYLPSGKYAPGAPVSLGVDRELIALGSLFAVEAPDNTMAPALWQGDIAIVDESPLSFEDIERTAGEPRDVMLAVHDGKALFLRYVRFTRGASLASSRLTFESEEFYSYAERTRYDEEVALDVEPGFFRGDVVALPGLPPPQKTLLRVLGRVIACFASERNRLEAKQQRDLVLEKYRQQLSGRQAVKKKGRRNV